MVIKNVDSSASGRYSCRIQTEVVISQIWNIIIMEEIAGRSCTVKTSKADSSCQEREAADHHRPLYTTVVRGDLIVLNCLAIGYPPPTYSWYKDGGRLSPAHDRFNIALNGSLVIENAQLDDSAHYRCSASNYLGKASSSARVQVIIKLL